MVSNGTYYKATPRVPIIVHHSPAIMHRQLLLVDDGQHLRLPLLRVGAVDLDLRYCVLVHELFDDREGEREYFWRWNEEYLWNRIIAHAQLSIYTI